MRWISNCNASRNHQQRASHQHKFDLSILPRNNKFIDASTVSWFQHLVDLDFAAPLAIALRQRFEWCKQWTTALRCRWIQHINPFGLRLNPSISHILYPASPFKKGLRTALNTQSDGWMQRWPSDVLYSSVRNSVTHWSRSRQDIIDQNKEGRPSQWKDGLVRSFVHC